MLKPGFAIAFDNVVYTYACLSDIPSGIFFDMLPSMTNIAEKVIEVSTEATQVAKTEEEADNQLEELLKSIKDNIEMELSLQLDDPTISIIGLQLNSEEEEQGDIVQ